MSDEHGMSPNDRNAWHVIAHANAEPGELIPEPYLTEKDSRFKIGDFCVFRFPLAVRRHSQALEGYRGVGRVLDILPGYGERHYSVQAIEEGLESSLVDNPPFILRESDLAKVSG